MAALSAVEMHRLRWQCRRGLLELDLALERFFERHAESLDAEDVPVLKALLELGDNELWDLVSGRVPCDIPRSRQLMQRLQEAWA